MIRNNLSNTLSNWTLHLIASQFNVRPSLRKYLKSTDGWTNFTIGLKTETGTMEQALKFHNGWVRVLKKIPDNVDATMRFVNDDVLKEMVETGAEPNAIIEEKGLKQTNDEELISSIAQKVIEENSKAVEDYKKGKESSLQFLVGMVMKETRGASNPEIVKNILEKILKE